MTSPRQRPWIGPRALLALACVGFCVLFAWFYGYTVDDTFISLRYARNLADGHGLVFSTDGSPPVEGYTNFLWVIIETPLFLLPLNDDQVLVGVKALGLVLGLATVLATFALTGAVTESRRTAAIAAGLLALMPYPAFWSAAGLETPLYLFLLTMGLREFVIEGRRGTARWRSMLVLSLAAMTRPEGLAFAMVLVAWELLGIAGDALAHRPGEARRRLRALAAGVAVFSVVFGAYFAWRLGFYGYVFPNTYYAKRAAPSPGHVADRLLEMRVFLRYLIPVAPLAVLGALALDAARSRERSLLIVSALALFAFAFVPAREWMPGYRYELPILPVLAVLSAVALQKWVFGAQVGWGRHQWVRVVAALVTLGYLVSPASGLEKNESYTDRLERAHVALGRWLGRYAPPKASYAGWDMGAVPYYSRLPRIFDIHDEGILCARTTHGSYEVAYFLEQEPTFILLPYLENPMEGVTPSSWGPLRFYLSTAFRESYELLFVLGWEGRPKYALYQRPGAVTSAAALSEARTLAARSMARPPLDKPVAPH